MWACYGLHILCCHGVGALRYVRQGATKSPRYDLSPLHVSQPMFGSLAGVLESQARFFHWLDNEAPGHARRVHIALRPRARRSLVSLQPAQHRRSSNSAPSGIHGGDVACCVAVRGRSFVVRFSPEDTVDLQKHLGTTLSLVRGSPVSMRCGCMRTRSHCCHTAVAAQRHGCNHGAAD